MKTRELISSRVFLGLVLGLSLVCAQVELNTLSWTCQGQAEIISDNFAQAQAQALDDAFKKAITNTLTEALGEKTFQEEARQIEDNFFKNPGKFVNRYKIITQGPQETSYLVEVEVELSKEQIQVGLVQAGLAQTRSKILMVAVIQDETGALKSNWLAGSGKESLPEKLLSLELQSWGYRLAKPEPILEPKKLDKIISDQTWLAKCRAKYGADIFILGKLKLTTELKAKAGTEKTNLENIEDTEEAGADLYSARAELELTLIDLTGQEKNSNLTAEQTATLAGKEPAKSRSIDLVTHSILPELGLALDRLTQKSLGPVGGEEEIIEIAGLGSYYQYLALFEGLKKIEAIRDLEPWGFAPGTARFSVRYSGDRESLNKAISGARFSEFRLLPIESDHHELKFKFETF